MLVRGLIVSAVLVYLGVLGCMAIPVHSSSADATPAPVAAVRREAGTVALKGLPYRGIGMQIQRVDWIDKYEKSIDEIADVGADTVLLVVDSRQENGTSGRIYLDMRMTPTPDQLGQLVQHAKKRQLRVVLMPIVLLDAPRGNEWRGTLKPESWGEWFDSYREMIKHFAWVAQANGVDVLVVGSELVSSEAKVDEWRRTISAVREVFKGRLTYSSNWDHYRSIQFWDDLDLIGMNSYWKLGENHRVKVEEIVENWKEIQSDLLPWVKEEGKPLMFLEVGWCSLSNAAHEPWDYTKTSESVDLELQKKLYEGFFKAWYGNPLLGGFSMWEWTPGDGGRHDRGYTPEGKPAEGVLREWLSRPRWDVK